MICRFILGIFTVVYVVALAVFVTGTFGWFGQERDPLSGVFLLPLGVPWVFAVNLAPEYGKPWLSALAPVLNLYLLNMVCRRKRQSQTNS